MMFEHTVGDVIRVMEHKITKRNRTKEHKREPTLGTTMGSAESAEQDSEEDDKVEEKGRGKSTRSAFNINENNLSPIESVKPEDAAKMKAEVMGMLDDKKLAEKLLSMIEETGLKVPLQDLHAMIHDALKLQGGSAGDCELLNDSILYQYAYLEKLIRSCKDERDPEGPSQKLLRGKDYEYNATLSVTREKVAKLMELAEEATE